MDKRNNKNVMNINIFKPVVTSEFYNNYYVVDYYMESSTNLRDAAWNLAIGQSVGNPSSRSEFETVDLFENHCCIILHDESSLTEKTKGIVRIAFPQVNINFEEDGVSNLLVQIMGGQCDIDIIQACRIENIKLTPSMERTLKGPVIGLKEMKEYCEVPDNKILLGGIVKPKTGLNPAEHLEVVKRLVDGGVNFIKEDEILCNPSFCKLEDRIPLVMDYIRKSGKKVFYCVSLHADPHKILTYVQRVYELGANGIHVNFHCGLGVYKSIRELNLPLLVHFQKSGDKILNCVSHKYSIHEDVIFKLVAMSGCSTLHAGMIGGYMNNSVEDTKKTISMLNSVNSVPALSCGMHPGLVDYIIDQVGHCNWMASVGGALGSHPMGTLAGVTAMRQAIDGNYGEEYNVAIKKWGLKK